ncbi:hypothetical protein ACHWQZ_G007515 [Mnemiopsis leidyi]
MFMLAVTVLAALALSSQSAAVLENSLLAGETADTEGSFFGLSEEELKDDIVMMDREEGSYFGMK